MAGLVYSHAPPPIPFLSNLENLRTSSDDNILKVTDIVTNLPPLVETWSYSHVISFIVQLLNLPKALEVDIKNFIISRQIDGAKLVKLDEVQLGKLGFNKLWCHHLSAAIEDLTEKETIDLFGEGTLLTTDTIGRKKGHRARVSVASIKKFGSFSRPGKVNYDTNVPNKPFSLPRVEIALVRHYMLSETVGLKEELALIKKSLQQNATTYLNSSKATVLDSLFGSRKTPKDNNGEDWVAKVTCFLTLSVVVGTIGYFTLKRIYRS